MGQIMNGCRRYLSCISSLLFLLTSFSMNLNAATLVVAPPPASIQAVINSAFPGDVVQLSNGTYIEEIYINKDITLQGNGIGASVIQCPTTPNPLTNTFVFTPTGATYHAFVLVENTANVVIQQLTIDGNSQPTNFLSNRFDGLAYHNAGGTIQNIHATNVQDSSPGGGTQHGFAIAGAIDDSNPHTINVTDCTIDNFQKAGIDMRGNTLHAVLTGNTITGETPPSLANANGIVVQFGALATIDSNIVTHLRSTVVGNDAVGILLSGAGANSSVTNNTSNDSDLGIYSANALGNITISNNIVNDNLDLGIYVQDTAGTSTLQGNLLTDNVNYNMYLFNSSTNNAFLLGQNQFIGSQRGLTVQGNVTTGPTVTMNTDSFTGTTVYYIEEIDAPNDIWPSTSTVFFDGLVSGHITLAEYNAIRTKILDKLTPVPNAALGLVLDYIAPSPPTVTNVSPNNGPTSGGNTVTVTGTNFLSSNTQVFFGVTPGTSVVVISDTELTVTAPAGLGTVDVTVTTPFGTSPITVDDEYTFAPLPPPLFVGFLRCGVLFAYWDPSPSSNIVSYKIYRNGVLVKTVPASDPHIYRKEVRSRREARQFSITAVDSIGIETAPVPINLLWSSSTEDC